MVKPVLMVSIIDGKIHLLNLKPNVKNYEAMGEPVVDADQETVEEYCQKAREIIISSDFPSCNYYWGSFPKVSRRYLKEIVVREARHKFWYDGGIRAAFKEVGQTHEDGVPKKILACLMIDDSEVLHIENELFGKFKHKLKKINSLPASLCAVIAHTEKPPGDFMVIAVGNHSTSMAISSPNGDVKIARQIPIGFDENTDCTDADLCKTFFNEISRDITNTNIFYRQNFQGAECNTFYMLGSLSLELAMERYGNDQLELDIRFGFSKSPLPSLELYEAAEWAYLFGAIYCHKNYNLLSRQIVRQWKFNRGYQLAMIAISSLIIACGFYYYQLDPVDPETRSDYKSKNDNLAVLQEEVFNLKKEVDTLKQFSGWETFYNNTYKNQPSWDNIFSEVAHNLPKEIVLESFRIEPGAGGVVRGWNALITGHIKVPEWSQGLELLRTFGARLHRSSNFHIEKLSYTPIVDKENRRMEEIAFDFQINAQLKSQDQK